MTKQELLEMLEENLSIDISTHNGCSCCNDSRMKIEIKFDNDVVCSDFIYLSSLQIRE